MANPDERPTVLSYEQNFRLIRDGSLNIFGLLVTGVLSLAIVPLMFRHLGQQQYGFFVFAVSLAALPAGLDFAVGVTITREVAAWRSGGNDQHDLLPFLSSAAVIQLALGLAGAAVLAGLGPFFSHRLQLDAVTSAIAPYVFLFVGLDFLANRILGLASATLVGLRRFDIINVVSISEAIAQVAGFAVLLETGRGLLAVALWQVFTSAAAAIISVYAARRLAPELRFRRFTGRVLRTRLSFILNSQLALVAGRSNWQIGVALVGLVTGAASTAPYYVGQRFPLALAGLASSFSQVLFPSMAASLTRRELHDAAAFIYAGTRSILSFILPFSVLLWILSPDLMRLWLGNPMPAAVTICRLTILAVLADCVGTSAMQALWSSGRVSSVSAITALTLVLNGTACAIGIYRFGASGALYALIIAMTAGSVLFIAFAAKLCPIRWPIMLQETAALLLPAALCGVLTLLLRRALSTPNLPAFSAILAAGCVTYAITFYLVVARPDERSMFRLLVGWR